MSGSPSVRFVGSARVALFALLVLIAATVCFTAGAAAVPVAYESVATFGGTGSGNGQFTEPNGVDVDWADRVWVGEYTGARLQWFAAGGAGWLGTYTKAILGPTYGYIGGIWSDERTGNLFVGDTSLQKIHRLAGGTVLVNDIGGSTPWTADRFQDIRGVALDAWGTVYGADVASNTVRAFAPDGIFQGTIGSSDPAEGGLDFPHGVDWDYDGRLYVASMHTASVNVFGPDRSFETSWPCSPVGLCVDPGGNLFVTEGQKVSRITTDGVRLDSYGSSGAPTNFFYLTSVRDDGKRNLYVTDAVNNMVTEIFAPVPTNYAVTAGSTRYDTAIKISQVAYPRGLVRANPDGWPTVVVATGENWPDALGASALAGAADGPILLVRKNLPLPPGLLAELTRLGPGRAYIVGGTGAVSPNVATAIDNALAGPNSVVRIAGSNRYETSRLVAHQVALWGFGDTAFLATGADFPDALSASPIAAAMKWPVYLADPQRSFISSMTAGGVTHATILGGTGVVPASAEASLVAEFGAPSVKRWAGVNRYDTSSIIASNALQLAELPYPLRANRVAFATGATFPDGLAGGPLQAKSWGPLLLTRPAALPSEAAAWLAARKNAVYHVRFLGGDGAITPVARNEVKPWLW